MEVRTSSGVYVELVEAPSPENMEQRIKLGLKKDVYLQQTRLGLRSMRGQFYGIVLPGMAIAMHCFRGLQRPLMHNNNMQGDQNVSVYTWKPQDNYEWHGDATLGTIVRLPPPPDSVYAVLVREQAPDEQGVAGVINRWNWIREDPILPAAPVDWQIRYSRKLWSREAQ